MSPRTASPADDPEAKNALPLQEDARALTVVGLGGSAGSVNEELATVNDELQARVEELTAANSDLSNFLGATDIATLFLDRALNVKRFTSASLALFNLIPSDIGRPLANVTNHLDYPALEDDAQEVVSRRISIEREVTSRDKQKHFLARLLPDRSLDDRIEGVVVLFVDITDRKRAEETAAADLQDMQILQELAARLVSEENVQTIYDEIMTAAIRLARADAGTVQIYDAETQELVLLATSGFGPGLTDYFHRVSAGSSTSCGIALQSGERTFVDFEPDDADEASRLHIEAGYLSAQSTPLSARSGERIAMLSTHWRAAQHRPSERELRFLDLLARQAADLIHQRQTAERLRRAAEMDAFRVKLADVLRPLADPLAIQEAGLRLAAEHLDLDRLLYNEIDPDVTTYTVRACYVREGFGAYAGQHPLGPWAESVRGLQQGITKVVHDAETEESFSPEEKAVCAGIGVRAFVTVPLLKEGRWVLNMVAHSSKPRPWTPHEVSLLEETAERTWAAVERAKAEAAQRQSEERLGLAVEIGELASWDWDMHTGQVTWNDRHYLLQGYEIGEVAPSLEMWLARVHPDDREETVALLEKARDERLTYVHEFRSLHTDGRIVWCSVRGRFFYDAQGQPERMVGVMEDITERKQNEASQREYEARQTFLLTLSDTLRPLADPAAIENAASRLLVEHLGANRALYREFVGTDDRRVGVIQGQHARDVAPFPMRVPVTDEAQGFPSPLLQGNKTLIVADTAQDPRLSEGLRRAWRDASVAAAIATAVIRNGRMVATLELHSTVPRAWTESEIQLIEEVADRTWTMAEHASVEKALQVANETLEQRVLERTRELDQRTEELAQVSAARQALLRHLVSAQEEERARISRDLHDDTGQHIAALLIGLGSLAQEASPAQRQELERLQGLAQELAQKSHRLSATLRPTALDDQGLVAALQNYVEQWQSWARVSVQLEIVGLDSGRLPAETETTIYRVVQEALTNIFKHATGPDLSESSRAQRISVVVQRIPGGIQVIVEDDGPGFPASEVSARTQAEGRLGLFGMQERARLVGGTLEIESAPGKGTTIHMRLPIPAS